MWGVSQVILESWAWGNTSTFPFCSAPEMDQTPNLTHDKKKLLISWDFMQLQRIFGKLGKAK